MNCVSVPESCWNSIKLFGLDCVLSVIKTNRKQGSKNVLRREFSCVCVCVCVCD